MKKEISQLEKFVFSKKIMAFYDYSYENLKEDFEFTNDVNYMSLTPEDLPKLQPLLEVQRMKETVFKPTFNIRDAAERLKQGEFCYACEEKKEIIAYHWVARNEKYIPEISSRILLRANEVYAYGAYVHPVQRGRNLNSKLVKYSHLELKKQGFCRTILARMIWNNSVEKSLKKAEMNYLGNCSISFFMTLRFFKNACRDVTLIDEGGMLEFYRKLSDRMK